MPAWPNHQDVRPSYFQETDPGAVGAGVFWVKPSTGDLKVRNAANAAWISLGGGGSQATVLKMVSLRG